MNSESVSSISAATSPYQAIYQNYQSGIGQLTKDFEAIGNALQSGSVSGAQSALATFQQDFQSTTGASPQQPFGTNSQANATYQKLANALQSGSLSGAKSAYATLQTTLQLGQHGAITSFSSLLNSFAKNSATNAIGASQLNATA
jgi:soluble cytochrome b562